MRGRHPHSFGKSGREGSQALLTDLQPDIANAEIRAQQQVLRLLQSNSRYIVERGKPYSFFKNPGEMIGAVRSILRQAAHLYVDEYKQLPHQFLNIGPSFFLTPSFRSSSALDRAWLPGVSCEALGSYATKQEQSFA